MRGGHQEEDDAGWVDEIDDDFDADALENEVSDDPSDENDMDWEDELPLEDEWDEGDAWAEWLEVEEDGFSESSEEDVEGEKAANELAAATSSRFVENGAVSYCVPTAHFHFQSADALSLATEYNSDDGSILLTALDRHGVAAWLVPSSAKAAGMGLGAPQNAHRLGGFQHPSDIFSMTCSPDGRYIITGGGSGILSIYTVDPSAPPRPPGSRDNAAMSGVTYFYTPIIAPLDVGPTNSPHFVEMFMHHQHQEQQQQQEDDEELREQQPARAAMTGGEENDANAHSTPGQMPHAITTENEQQFFRMLLNQRISGPLSHMAEDGQDVMSMFRHTARSVNLLHEAGCNVWVSPHSQQQQEQAPLAPGSLECTAAEAGGGGPSFKTGGEEKAVERSRGRGGEGAGQLAAGVQASAAEGPGLGERTGAYRSPAAGAAAFVASDTGVQGSPRMGAGVTQCDLPPGSAAGKGGSGRQAAAQHGQRSTKAGQPAAVIMAGMVGLGHSKGANTKEVPINPDAMVNGVRIGRVDGKQRVVAAEQSGYVYVFELPCSSTPRSQVLQQLLCGGLGESSNCWCMMPVSMFRGELVPAGVGIIEEPRALKTAAIGPFGAPVNLAAPSPNGAWLAVVGDAQVVWLVDQRRGFQWEALPFGPAGVGSRVQEDISIGAQYCCWNRDSTLLAVSSDVLQSVFVFNPATQQQVHRVEGHARPCLGVLFAPWDPHLLIYGEEAKHVFLRHLDGAEQSSHLATEDFAERAQRKMQLLRIEAASLHHETGGMHLHSSRRRRITGAAAGPHGDLFVSIKQGLVLRYFAILDWSPQLHSLWPATFQKLAQHVLVYSSRESRYEHCDKVKGVRRNRVGLWSLPVSVILSILKLLAGSRLQWSA